MRNNAFYVGNAMYLELLKISLAMGYLYRYLIL